MDGMVRKFITFQGLVEGMIKANVMHGYCRTIDKHGFILEEWYDQGKVKHSKKTSFEELDISKQDSKPEKKESGNNQNVITRNENLENLFKLYK